MRERKREKGPKENESIVISGRGLDLFFVVVSFSFSFKSSREEGDEEGENIITQKSPYSSCLYIYSCILNRIELS